jgi:hypothetical protein
MYIENNHFESMYVNMYTLQFNNKNMYITTPDDDSIRIETCSGNYSCVDCGTCIISE